MKIERLAAFAPRTRALAEDLAEVHMTCLGCKDCQGLCMALAEAVNLPPAILKEQRGEAR
jgi:hypothetical protein